jgi:hypothetical protein
LSGRAAYPLLDEYDVQDILWVFLKMWRASATREDPTPRSAGAASRIDFTFPDAFIGVEVKFVSPGRRTADIKAELLTDLHDAGMRKDLRHLLAFVVERPPGLAHEIDDLDGKEGDDVELRIVRVSF